ncbi:MULTISPECIES: hypothetical protein [Cysteiniphilum]|uniref:Uncharacterized protein n=1 Tax=Cysteiniphilum litorale TaxID=2056700 RepID=A0A8J2Z633_9GAMM|nr:MULTISPECIES: hypothetical protein [Cysteiniphilum]GGG04016.1 hypothetical protein GCM10010995_21880 [Cysteiniphilum litorale]
MRKEYEIKDCPTLDFNYKGVLDLLVAGSPNRFDLESKIDFINTPHAIHHLRKKHGWDIEHKPYSYTKPNGKRSWTVRYYLSDKHKKYALENIFKVK